MGVADRISKLIWGTEVLYLALYFLLSKYTPKPKAVSHNQKKYKHLLTESCLCEGDKGRH